MRAQVIRGLALVALGLGALGAAKKPSFEDVEGWGPLRWSMTLEVARKALAGATWLLVNATRAHGGTWTISESWVPAPPPK